ncbi:MAG: DNA (cytosine-5-)-methyltransferase [Clostridiales bacterium]|jgi:DNA (cytosine-5)-methyltransferase 1|nr:DNA (cytosine-5-)-methyltransferase [Clostridiales bacterium]
MMNKTVRFIDLFAGMGGIRLGFEQAFRQAGYKTECVLTSEIKESAVSVYKKYFNEHHINGDITKIKSEDIPDFDFLLGGFPCQAFSVAGKQRGFADTRGTLFFEIERILKDKNPYGFLLENVEGLVVHDLEHNTVKPGRTLKAILYKLETELGYTVTWDILDAQNFGLAQARRRIYIVGTKKGKVSLENFPQTRSTFADVMEAGGKTLNGEFAQKLFKKYKPEELYGKAIKDKRGGENNIHSWDIGIRGHVTQKEQTLLNALLLERRKRHWAEKIGIDWMDGMPLTAEQIRTFHNVEDLQTMLDKLVEQGYLVLEHPKKRVESENSTPDRTLYERIPDVTKPMGYNIVTGKLSFEFSRILNPQAVTPTLVAMDMSTIGVIDNCGIRKLTLREGLRLFGYPEDYRLCDFEDTQKGKKQGFDLLGNTVCVPVIEAVSERLAAQYISVMSGGAKQ